MRRMSLSLALVLLAALPALAETFEERVAAALTEGGYDVVAMERTWLGRLRVVAEDGASRREIVFNPHTGEILRDYSVPIASLGEAERAVPHWDRDDDDGPSGGTGAAITAAPQGESGGGADVVIPESLPLGGD